MQNSKIPLNVKQPVKKHATNTKTLLAGNMLYAKGHHNTKTLAANTKQHKQVKITPSLHIGHQKTQQYKQQNTKTLSGCRDKSAHGGQCALRKSDTENTKTVTAKHRNINR